MWVHSSGYQHPTIPSGIFTTPTATTSTPLNPLSTTPASSLPSEAEAAESGFSIGARAGIGVGVGILVGVLALSGLVFLRRLRARSSAAAPAADCPGTPLCPTAELEDNSSRAKTHKILANSGGEKGVYELAGTPI